MVSRPLLEEGLLSTHNCTTGGYFGIEKTVATLIKRPYFWIGQTADVMCAVCSVRKGPTRCTVSQLRPTVLGAPFKRLAIDILGLLPTTVLGNRHIAVVKCYFAK